MMQTHFSNDLRFLRIRFDTTRHAADASRPMTPKATATGASAIALAPRVSSASRSILSSSVVVVGLLLGLVLLPLISAGCGPPT